MEKKKELNNDDKDKSNESTNTIKIFTDNNEETWKVKFLDDSNPKLFYIVKFNEKKLKFSQTTLNKLLGLSHTR